MRYVKPREACALSQKLKWEHMEPHGRILWKEVRYWPSADPAEAGGEEKRQEHLNQRVSHIIRLWSLGAEIFWRKTYMWSLGRPVLDTSYKENMSGRRVFNNKILSGEKFVFFSFLLLLLLKKLWWKPNCVWYVRRGGGNEGEGERRQCVVRCGVRGLKAREDQKDKTSIPSHFHVFTLAYSLLKMRKINSNLSSTK